MLHSENRPLAKEESASDSNKFSSLFGSHAPNLVQRALICFGRKTFLRRGKLRYLWSNLIFLFQRPLDIKRFGSSFRIGLHNNLIDYGLLLHPTYNQVDIDFLREGLGPQSVCVDIGCNIGLYALQLSQSGAKVIAIDANEAMIETLRFNAAASKVENFEIVHAAVSDGEGRADLAIHNDDLAIVGLVENPEGALQTRALSSILNDYNVERIDALKIDIEGFEDRALAPFLENAAADLLPKRIVIERTGSEDYPACVRAFAKRGYTVVGRSRQNSFYELQNTSLN